VTAIAFHFGAPDKVAYVCRLLRKATAAGKKIVVTADRPTLSQLDADLWAVSATDFISHCFRGAEGRMSLQSQVIMVPASEADAISASILVNLGEHVPHGFTSFERVIEVVSTDASDRDLARQRWKHYTAQGFSIDRHDLALKS